MRRLFRPTFFPLLPLIVLLWASPSWAASEAVSYQIDVAHDGNAVFKKGFVPPLKLRWARDLDGIVSYPLIAKGRAFVTVGNPSGYGSQVYALSLKTGETIWQRSLSGNNNWSGIAYDAGRLLVFNSTGEFFAAAEDTGQVLWSDNFAGFVFGGTPIATAGSIYFGGLQGGGFVYAIDDASGAVRWNVRAIDPADAVAFGDQGLFVSFCDYHRLDPVTGAEIWERNDDGCGVVQSYFDSRVYVDNSPGGFVLDARSGALEGSYAVQRNLPAFLKTTKGDTYVISVFDGALFGVSLKTGRVVWSFAGDGEVVTSPIVVDNLVVEGSGKGNLYLLDGETGTAVWSTNVGTGFMLQGNGPMQGFGAGQGVVIAPAGSHIFAFTGKHH